MNIRKAHLIRALALATLVSTGLSLAPVALRAADHGDAPALDQDQGADIADFFLFLDPNNPANVVLIGTVHGFIVPSEAGNFAAFDPNVRFRFELYNHHVNVTPSPNLPAVQAALGGPKLTVAQAAAHEKFLATITPNMTIDATFGPRTAATVAQTATLTFTGFPAFKSLANHGVFKTVNSDGTGGAILTTPASVTVQTGATSTANAQALNSLSAFPADASQPAIANIQFFAGEAADPFFFDIPAFNAFVATAKAGAPDVTKFNRGRNSFAGYNVLAIAIGSPVSLMQGANAGIGTNLNRLGADFLTQRQAIQEITSNGVIGSGAYKAIDRIGNPAINVALIPFLDKNKYNAGTPRSDALLQFAGDIVGSVNALHLGTLGNSTYANILVDLEFSYGDLLKLDLTGQTAGGYPNGRQLQDDTITTILTVLNTGTPTSDNVTQEVPPQPVFPFVALPYQPLGSGAAVGADGTQN